MYTIGRVLRLMSRQANQVGFVSLSQAKSSLIHAIVGGPAMSTATPAWARKRPLEVDVDATLPTWARKRSSDSVAELKRVAECSAILLEMLIKLKMQGKLSAKDVCSLVYWGKGAGLQGVVCTLAKDPNLTGGHFSEHFDAITGLKEGMQSEDLIMLDIPGRNRCDSESSTVPICACLGHMALARELSQVPDFAEKHSAKILEFGSMHWENPFVLEKGKRVIPLGMCLDGVAFGHDNRDGVLGIWLINLITRRRHLLLPLRKCMRCNCGCKGWCSLYYAWSFVSWNLCILRSGIYPSKRFGERSWVDGTTAGDRCEALAGTAIGFLATVVILKADWSDAARSLGLPNWQHAYHPCFKCFAQLLELYLIDDSRMTLPRPLKTQADYLRYCDEAETLVKINSSEELSELLGCLNYVDKKKDVHGRELDRDIPKWNLRSGMRLTPTPDLLNVAELDNLVSHFPTTGINLVFWKHSRCSMTIHRNPLFSEATGVTIDMICVDELHTMHSGIFPCFIPCVWYELMDADVWCLLKPGMSTLQFYELCMTAIQNEFNIWRLEAPEGGTVHALTLASLGPRDSPLLKGGIKAHECGVLLHFTVHLLRKFIGRISDAYLDAGECLENYLVVTRANGPIIPATDQELLISSAFRLLGACDSCHVELKPEFHLALHLVLEIKRFGNPRFSGTWVDEGLHCELGVVCEHAHSAVWSKRIMAVFAHSLGPTAEAVNRSSKVKSQRRGRTMFIAHDHSS